MTTAEEKILEMVREQLQRPNPPGTEPLYGRAARIDDSIRELSLRQFNARYVLRVHRQMAREKEVATRDVEAPEGAAPPERPPADRSALRQLFYDLAAEVVDTETGPELIDFYDRELDRYVDRILAALPSGYLQRRRMSPEEDVLDRICRRLRSVRSVEIERVILYGSRARDDAREHSDIDLLVVYRSQGDRRRTRRRLRDGLGELRPRVDLRVVTEEQFRAGRDTIGSLVEAAHRMGRVLYRADNSE